MPSFDVGIDVGIDLGTSAVKIYTPDRGIVLNEPSVVAVDRDTDEIIAIGSEAYRMLGRTSDRVAAVYPLHDGVISNYNLAEAMLTTFVKMVCGNKMFMPRVVVCVPIGITEVEKRAVQDVTLEAGAQSVALIEEPIAAAIGAGIDISAPNGNMIVDIGGGTTDIAIISLGDIVVSDSIKVAGDKFDEAIVRYVRRRYNLLIGERTAEAIKKNIGYVFPHNEPQYMEVKGRSLDTGLPAKITMNSLEMLEALADPISSILDAICGVIERTPEELSGDILKNGIVMTGGGSLVRGLDRLIAHVTKCPTRIAKNPIQCVAIGTGRSLDNISVLPEGALNLARRQQKY